MSNCDQLTHELQNVSISQMDDLRYQMFTKYSDQKGHLTEEDWIHFLHDSEVFSTEETVEHIGGEIFQLLDINQDGQLDEKEFLLAWNRCLRVMLHPYAALVIVDVQNDFISGTLSLSNCPSQHNGLEVVPRINEMLSLGPDGFPVVVYTYDWHPNDHISFVENAPDRTIKSTPDSPHKDASKLQVGDIVTFITQSGETRQRLWPRHCVQNTEGAQLDATMRVVEGAVHLYKGTYSDIDSYSAFFDNDGVRQTELNDRLVSKGVTDVYVCGLATDVCVYHTAKHALNMGYRVTLVEDASRGVDVADIENNLNDLRQSHAHIAQTADVSELLRGKRRPITLLLASALHHYKKEKEN